MLEAVAIGIALSQGAQTILAVSRPLPLDQPKPNPPQQVINDPKRAYRPSRSDLLELGLSLPCSFALAFLCEAPHRCE